MKLLYCMLLWSTLLFSSRGGALVRTKTKCARGNLDQALRKNFFTINIVKNWNRLPREEMNPKVLNTIPEYLKDV